LHAAVTASPELDDHARRRPSSRERHVQLVGERAGLGYGRHPVLLEVRLERQRSVNEAA
jgi:hypothetical protein